MATPSRSMLYPTSGTSLTSSAATASKKRPSAEWAVIVAAAVSAVGAYLTNRKRQQFAADMSNTAHQREVRDLRAAGLNPILSAGGRGASSPDPSLLNPGEQATSAAGLHNLRQVQKAQTRHTNALANEKEMHNIKTGVKTIPWQMGKEALEGKIPNMPGALKNILGVMDTLGTTNARPGGSSNTPLGKARENLKRKNKFKGNKARYGPNWNKAPRDPFRHNYTPVDRGKNRRD